jgi:hypothetical protein
VRWLIRYTVQSIGHRGPTGWLRSIMVGTFGVLESRFLFVPVTPSSSSSSSVSPATGRSGRFLNDRHAVMGTMTVWMGDIPLRLGLRWGVVDSEQTLGERLQATEQLTSLYAVDERDSVEQLREHVERQLLNSLRELSEIRDIATEVLAERWGRLMKLAMASDQSRGHTNSGERRQTAASPSSCYSWLPSSCHE